MRLRKLRIDWRHSESIRMSSRRRQALTFAAVRLITLGALNVAKGFEQLEQITKRVAYITVPSDVVAELRNILPQQIYGILGLWRWQNRARIQGESVKGRQQIKTCEISLWTHSTTAYSLVEYVNSLISSAMRVREGS